MEIEVIGSDGTGDSNGHRNRYRHRHRRQKRPWYCALIVVSIAASIVVLLVAVYRNGGETLLQLFPSKNNIDSNHEWSVGTTTTATGSSSSSSNSNSNSSSTANNAAAGSNNYLEPPLARREEDRAVYVGVAPPGWDPSIPRQQSDDASTKSNENENENINSLMDPPVAVQDPYGWMRDETRSNIQVLEHLKAENNYTAFQTLHFQTLQNKLYEEMMGYVQETSHSFPFLSRDFYYYRRTIEGQSYPLHCRAPKSEVNALTSGGGDYLKQHLAAWDGSSGMPILPNESVYLDENRFSQGLDYFEIGSLEISPSQSLVAYTVDYAGNELYELIVQRMDDTEEIIFQDSALVVCDDIIWGPNDDVLFYIKSDDAQRWYQVYKLDLNTKNEVLLYEETDILYWVGIYKSMDRRYLFLQTASSEASEIHYLDLMNSSASAEITIIADRRPNVLYSVEHYKGTWWMTSTVQAAANFQLWTAPVGKHDRTRVLDPTTGQPLLDGIAIEGLSVFATHMVVRGREDGIPRLWILHVDDDDGSKVLDWQRLEWKEEPAHHVDLSHSEEFNTSSIVVEYQSLVSPLQHIEVSFAQLDKRDVLHESPVPGYNKQLYECKRIQVLSRDGHTQIPVSLVHLHSTMEKAESNGKYVPIHLYAYGAYGDSIEDSFSSSRLPLLKRGIIYAVAHVRGGGEMGRPWYEDGKLLSKKHTFDDFVDVARFLIEEKKWTNHQLLSCEGRSAGGLTMGASLNQAPELFRVAILGVPFVDLVATMTDASIPLTAGEWEEWGNPNEEKYFQYMMEYSPMQNVKKTTYPSMLLLAGLFDPRVAYWEPLKLTATLRHTVIPHADRPIFLKTDMTSGHFSASDRYKHVRSKAFEYSFMLDQLGISD